MKRETWRGEEELGQKGAWKQAGREGESSNMSFHLVKGGFWAPKSLQMVIAAMKLKDTYSLEGKL